MPLAIEAVRQIDAIFAAEAAINGKPAAERLAVRQRDIAPLVAALEAWMRAERAKLSRHNDLAQAMDYMLKRWGAFTRFLHDGRICLTNNAAERMLRGAALGRKAWLFAGSDQGGERAAAMYSLIQTAKLNGVDPRAWLADVLARIADMPQQRLHELLPWNAAHASRGICPSDAWRGGSNRTKCHAAGLRPENSPPATTRAMPTNLDQARSSPHDRPPVNQGHKARKSPQRAGNRQSLGGPGRRARGGIGCGLQVARYAAPVGMRPLAGVTR